MEPTQRIELVGSRTQLLVEIGEVAEVLHWGKRLPSAELGLPNASLALQRPVPFGRLDKDVPVSLHPELGRGSFGSPGLEGHRYGLAWAPVFSLTHCEHDSHSLTLIYQDPQAELRLTIDVHLGEDDVLKTRQTVTNLAQGPYWVTRFAHTLPLDRRAEELLTFHGRWVNEFQTERLTLHNGGYQQENRRGRTSHEHYPALIAGTSGFGELSGDVWGFHLAWSGNHRLRVDVKADGRRVMQAEALYLPGEIALAEGKSISTPWLYATYSEQGLSRMSQQFHRHVREQIVASTVTQQPRPIHLNTWEGIYFDHNPQYIKQMASEAARMGVERFIIDDGWFKGRNNDKAALGDWVLDERKYPKGLTDIVNHVNELGMEFGLWFEPEMINKDSDLYRRHPEWLLAVEGYHQPTGRHQYVIDLQNPEAFDYLFERLDHFLSNYAIAYIKWDMNREVVQPAHHDRAAGHKQVERYYQLVDKVRAAHPQVEIESCAAGGGRIDFEVLKRTHRFWTSDNNDALERQTIQRGMSLLFPPEVMGSHIGSGHCHSTRRRHSIEFRGLTALFGHMGIELDPVSESEQEKAGFARYVALHKQLRPLLHHGVNWRLPTEDSAHQAYCVVADDQSQAVAVVAQLAMPTYALSGQLRFAGLDDSAQYHVSLLDKPLNFDTMVCRQPPWTAQGCTLSGAWLHQVGLAVPILDPESAILIALTRVNP
ncbi:alpha-galactosidase [Vibrio scophthalmi]|uniref:alpha-galactosidase n=1 Tax=Vibrio scophthalmi TaxID=45658 RepID=UPI002FF0665B